MKITAVLIIAMALTSCAGNYATQTMQGTPQVALIPPPATEYVSTPTADIIVLQGELMTEKQQRQKAEDSERAKQLQVDELIRLQLEYTVTASAQTQIAEMAYTTATAQSVIATQWAGNMTATAYPTAIEIQRQAIALRNTELTAQAEYPDLLIKKTDAESYAENWEKREIIATTIKIILCFFLAALGFYFVIAAVKKWQQIDSLQHAPVTQILDINETEETPVPSPVATDLQPVNANRAYSHTEQFIIPCSQEQFEALVIGHISNGVSLAINNWEGKGRPFVRDSFYRMRDWMRLNKFAISTGNGGLSLVDAGTKFFVEYLNNRTIPTEYKFETEKETA
jgi:hypothetical protein